MIDRAYTKAEARYIPNGPDSTADMAHPTRTGDVVAFASPPYQFDGATPGTLVARSTFFGQHGYAPDLQDLDANSLMRSASLSQIEQMVRSGAISAGMLPKVESCITALKGGVNKTHIIDGRTPHALLLEIYTEAGVGTEIVL